jgi:protein associated with RNAse G/E
VSESHTQTPPSDERNVIVSALKFDGRIHRQWPARLSAQRGSLIVLSGVFDEEIHHPLLGHIVSGTHSTEYYWTDRWYNIFRFREPDGRLRNYYCNINQPACFDGGTLTFVDLDIDVLVAPDFTYQVLDEDEFQRHAEEFSYTTELQAQVRRALSELLALIERREFPFRG